MLDPVLEDAHIRLTNLRECIREAATTGPFHTYHSPKMLSPRKSKMTTSSSNADVRALVSQSRKYIGIIRQKGTEFLQEKGFTGGGMEVKAKSQHTPKDKAAMMAELERLKAQLAAFSK